jgi:hypothetical protein
MMPDWLMDQFSALGPNGTQGSVIHFQHPDQPLSATTLPQTHPLKTRIATLLQALHFMCAAGKSIRSAVAFATSRSIFSSLGVLTSVRPAKAGHTTRAVNGPFFQAPIFFSWNVSSFHRGFFDTWIDLIDQKTCCCFPRSSYSRFLSLP